MHSCGQHGSSPTNVLEKAEVAVQRIIGLTGSPSIGPDWLCPAPGVNILVAGNNREWGDILQSVCWLPKLPCSPLDLVLKCAELNVAWHTCTKVIVVYP